ncbi:hypothetical protein EKN06_00275 [Croceicoccus ponticola]|uniref:DoxX family membrane protein n=1 Tax=Croceicoccus ponticola TaxID=2217664 RepID=A0A437GZB6_9SPHN|nr:DoxX family protein [Croceicoccus ponticola]RVQ68707.1 hypothetical protein EKN06_00275 [Croceicoccus ponticola]
MNLKKPPRVTNSRNTRLRAAARWLLAIFYGFAGVAHLASPAPFLKIMPNWVPWPGPVVFLTGVAELLGAIALLQPMSMRLRQMGAIGLAAYALCVWPANVNHMVMDFTRPDGAWIERSLWAYHVPRMLLQPVLIWLALWSGGVIDWPRRQRLSN